jgi:hypothetical protein
MTAWEEDHAGLHTSAAMRAELDRRFARRHFEWCPYLCSEFGERSLEAEEARLIRAEEIQATGFRYVAELRAS